MIVVSGTKGEEVDKQGQVSIIWEFLLQVLHKGTYAYLNVGLCTMKRVQSYFLTHVRHRSDGAGRRGIRIVSLDSDVGIR